MDGEKDFVAELLTRGADPNWSGRKAKYLRDGPLHIAAMNGHVECVELLLHANANLVARDDQLQTPLHLACRYGRLAVVRNLVETGADIELEDRNGRTPIHEAFQALETNSNRMSWYERKAESSAQDSEFVHQLEVDEWIEELDKRLNDVEYDRKVMEVELRRRRKRERKRRKEEAKARGAAEATNIVSVLAAVHGDGLETVAEESSDVDSTADNVQVLKSRVTMENIMRAMSDQSRDAFTAGNSEDESSSCYSSACEDPVDGEENSVMVLAAVTRVLKLK